jgi:hypothetical protein
LGGVVIGLLELGGLREGDGGGIDEIAEVLRRELEAETASEEAGSAGAFSGIAEGAMAFPDIEPGENEDESGDAEQVAPGFLGDDDADDAGDDAGDLEGAGPGIEAFGVLEGEVANAVEDFGLAGQSGTS